MLNVIVTGGTRGLGLAIGATLAAGGYRVIAIARTESEDLRRAIRVLGSSGNEHLSFLPYDLSDTRNIGAMVSGLKKQYGPIYGLVNNAGIGTSGVLAMMGEQQIEELTNLNINAPLILCKYAVRSMMVERRGRVVNISSIVGSRGFSGLSAYSATKAALLGFTRSLAREVGSLGITVNAIAPGFISTEMTRDLDDGQRDQIARRSALRRLAEAGDIAGAVEYLMSEKARNITGTTLTIDAGNSA
jgi:3-oxoacyl-[acyl-carrier protein] reductase